MEFKEGDLVRFRKHNPNRYTWKIMAKFKEGDLVRFPKKRGYPRGGLFNHRNVWEIISVEKRRGDNTKYRLKRVKDGWSGMKTTGELMELA